MQVVVQLTNSAETVLVKAEDEVTTKRLTLPFPAPCLSQFLHPGGSHLQQTLAWPWQTLSGSSRHTLPVQTEAAAARGKDSGPATGKCHKHRQFHSDNII